MANCSTTGINLKFASITGANIHIDMDDTRLARLREAFCNLSYGGDGNYQGGGRFYCCGRWSYANMFDERDLFFDLIKEAREVQEELGATNEGNINEATHIYGVYYDMDLAMDWVGTGWFSIGIRGDYVFNIEHEFNSATLADFVKTYLPERLEEFDRLLALDEPTDEESEGYSSIEIAVEDTLDDLIDEIS